MKQTAVEWLADNLKMILPQSQFNDVLIQNIIEQAKEMEKEKQGYSEEEVENILIEYVKTNPSKPYRVLSWFGTFKKK